MIKRTQNKVAESRFTLPTVMAYAIAVWLLSGQLTPSMPITSSLSGQGAWVQFACFLISSYLMVELNNSNALIRIYSRTVSCSFIVITCASCFLFSSMAGAIVGLCFIMFYITLFHCYQDKQSTGWTFYAFLCIGLASTVSIHILYYLPVFWLLMNFQLSALSWRTFFASIIGLLSPYWFYMPVAIYQGHTQQVASHFLQLADVTFPYDYNQLTVNQVLLLVFITTLAFTGIIHYWRNSNGDRIRIRQLYGIFSLMVLITLTFLLLQPQHYDFLVRILIINTAPLIAHFLSLTHTKVTNIAFYAICAVALLLTGLNLWMPSLSF